MFAAIRALHSAKHEELFLTPGKPEEQDPSTGNYSACSETVREQGREEGRSLHALEASEPEG